ncbi:cyclic nucleotide-binding domain-containing protein [Candidatus Chlorohelix sp.]|uniref:cyclic nucleotide-binding domain-containing protein n=1 Tax=Candidatus Chlorohelix sp. TaxID=3139201 RepID=UPI00303E543E
MDNEYLIENLKKVPILAALKHEHLDMLAKLSATRNFKKGEIIIKQGDPGSGLFVILSGSVSVSNKNRPGLSDNMLNELGRGDFFGEMSLIDGYPRSATCTAAIETQVVELNRWVFLDVLRREPSIAVAMLPVLCRRIRTLEEQKTKR